MSDRCLIDVLADTIMGWIGVKVNFLLNTPIKSSMYNTSKLQLASPAVASIYRSHLSKDGTERDYPDLKDF